MIDGDEQLHWLIADWPSFVHVVAACLHALTTLQLTAAGWLAGLFVCFLIIYLLVMCLQALRKEPLTVYGDGKQTRSFQYVSDLVSSRSQPHHCTLLASSLRQSRQASLAYWQQAGSVSSRVQIGRAHV